MKILIFIILLVSGCSSINYQPLTIQKNEPQILVLSRSFKTPLINSQIKKLPFDLTELFNQRFNLQSLPGATKNGELDLIFTLTNYQERIGSSYGADQPAIVGFRLELKKANQRVWLADYYHADEFLSSNILKLNDPTGSNFKWNKAEDLLRAGIDLALTRLNQDYSAGNKR